MRLLVAGAAPLSPDEAYYWVWSRALAPGYLDHPPMVALWIRLGTWLAGDGALGVRLLAPLAAAAGSCLLADAAERLARGTGVRAAVLLNATLILGAGAVTMTPDTPLLFFWTLALWAMARVVQEGRGAWWLAVGAASGLALDSKYTAGLLGAGLAVWLVGLPAGRAWLAGPSPWLGGLVAAAVFSPVLAWNAAHGWVSFAKQGGRTGDFEPAQAVQHVAELVASQIGLVTPLVFALCVAGVWRLAPRWREPRVGLVLALVLPGAALFLEHALGDRVQANWPAVLAPAACLAAADATRYWRPAAWLGFGMTAVVYLQAAAPLPLPRWSDPTLIRLGGWAALAEDADRMRTEQGAEFLVADSYGLASLLARGTEAEVLAPQERWRLMDLPRRGVGGALGLLVVSARHREPPDTALWANAVPVGELVRGRGGVQAEVYRVYRLAGQPGLDAAILPHPRRD